MTMTTPQPTLRVGDTVPEIVFEVFDPVRKDFAKASFRELTKDGHWIGLVFYPGDFTFVCPTELADVAAHQKEWDAMKIRMVSFSTDSVFVHMAWQREETLLKDVRYPMGADRAGAIARAFGVYDDQAGLARRGTFLVNPQGRLVLAEVNDDNIGRSADEFLRKAKAAQYAAAHPGEACPARWDTGKTALTPSAKLVGRVGQVVGK